MRAASISPVPHCLANPVRAGPLVTLPGLKFQQHKWGLCSVMYVVIFKATIMQLDEEYLLMAKKMRELAFN